MARARMPFVLVFAAMLETIQAGNLPATLEMPDLFIRTRRNRYSIDEERAGGCIALAFVSDGPRDPGEQDPALGEMYRELAIDVIADADLPTEVEAEEEQTKEDFARLEILGQMLLETIKLLKQAIINQAEAPTPFSGVALWVEEIGLDDDEDLADIEGRLVARINVLYRVRSDDPTILLAQGG